LSGLDTFTVLSVRSAVMDNGGRPDVVLRGVTKRFGDLVAVDSVDLEVHPGEFLALLGPSGCGKTTTLRMIAGFDEPTAGEIEIDGRPTVGIPPNKRNVNTVFQAYALFPHMTVLDNVAYGLKQRKVGKNERYREAGEALELVHLTGRERAKPAELSGGMQQRVALARALVMKPKVLLLDEPLGALDLKLRKAMQVELKRIQRDVGITFVVVTHDQEEAMAMADRIAVMNAGRIDQLDVPSEIYDRPATPFVADFIGEMNHLEGTLEGGDGNLVAAVGDARFGIGRVVREARTGDRVRLGVRPEEVHANTRGDGVAATCQTAMVLGHHVQIVATLESGDEIVALQRRAGDDPLEEVRPGDKLWLGWSPSAALLLGPADGAADEAARDPLEVQA
jgi:spermidine/putrescine ABC transporter ATP-binding subunit